MKILFQTHYCLLFSLLFYNYIFFVGSFIFDKQFLWIKYFISQNQHTQIIHAIGREHAKITLKKYNEYEFALRLSSVLRSKMRSSE